MAEHTFDAISFRLLYPAFSDTTTFTDTYLTAQFGQARVYITPYDNAWTSGDLLQTALNLMTAHLVQINVILSANGRTPTLGVLQSATIDKVTVSNAPPPTANGWQYWLATTPYGQQLWALLRSAAGVGPYIGGLPERAGFRKVGGYF